MIDKVLLPMHWRKGLGTQVCTLSALYNYGVKNIIFETESIEYKNFKLLKDYFSLSNLDISLQKREKDFFLLSPNDFFKINTPYISKVSTTKKAKYVAVSMYNDNSIMEKLSSKYPYYKQYLFQDYQKIISRIKSMGYDVITIDSKNNDLLSKLDLMNDFVEVLVSYEGGMAHLAHCLNIPTIMIPWRIRPNDYLEELLHLDNKTYFLSNLDEFLTFDTDRFNLILDDLKIGKGNNRFVNNQLSYKIKKGRYVVNKTEIWPVFDQTEHLFFSKIYNQ